MKKLKVDTLLHAEFLAKDHWKTKEKLAELRERFIDACVDAKEAGATQQEIADRTGFARQRISQFLAEREL